MPVLQDPQSIEIARQARYITPGGVEKPFLRDDLTLDNDVFIPALAIWISENAVIDTIGSDQLQQYGKDAAYITAAVFDGCTDELRDLVKVRLNINYVGTSNPTTKVQEYLFTQLRKPMCAGWVKRTVERAGPNGTPILEDVRFSVRAVPTDPETIKMLVLKPTVARQAKRAQKNMSFFQMWDTSWGSDYPELSQYIQHQLPQEILQAEAPFYLGHELHSFNGNDNGNNSRRSRRGRTRNQDVQDQGVQDVQDQDGGDTPTA